jgi:AraC family transcriptional regulator, regulatory protein of adaptative response / methylated-DNA-[protein]-cysteine methyltransferase
MQETRLPPIDIMHKAVIERDESFEGVFFLGVKTTGIFCRPGCRARTPKPQNIEFFPSAKEALIDGYRACKLCHPMEMSGAIPDWLQPILKEIEDNPEISLKDDDLRQRNVDPVRIRRWFKKHHDMTFQAYLRARRVNHAHGQISQNGSVTDAAFDSGYESLSGFASAFQEITGFSPSHSAGRKIVSLTRLLTPVGPMFAGASEEGICLLEFNDRRMLDVQIKVLSKRMDAEFVSGEHRHFAVLEQQLQEYFAGQRQEFTVPLFVPGTPFQQQVWKGLQDIPYGETRSYQGQAEAIGNPKAIRAVARVNGENRIGILIPCHRVIGKDGKLVGYGGGLWRKQYLLNLERTNKAASQ